MLSPVIPVGTSAGKPHGLLEVRLDLVNVLSLRIRVDIHSRRFALKDGLDEPESEFYGVFHSHDCRRVAVDAVWSFEKRKMTY